MHAIVARQAGGPEVLELAEVERPVPGPGQLLVKVAAAGRELHRHLQAQRHVQGAVSRSLRAPRPPARWRSRRGRHRCSPSATGWPPLKAPTATPATPSSMRTRRSRFPDGVDDFTAAALPLQGITAHYLINSSFRVEPGHTVLLHAGAGGVGLLHDPAAQGQGRPRHHHRLHRRQGAAGPRSRRRPRAALRRLRRPGPGTDRRNRRGRGVRRRREGHLRRFPRCPAHPRHAGALRRRLRPGSAVRSAAAQRRRLAVPDPADHGPLPAQRPGTPLALR